MYFGKLRLFSAVAERQMVIPLSSLFAEEGVGGMDLQS